jgi:hypothetical protein
MVADQGILQGEAWEVLQARRSLAPDCRIWADVMVKHAVPVGSPRLEDLAQDTWHRGSADALILSGTATGAATDPAGFRTVRGVLNEAPLLVGSGLTAAQLPDVMKVADGAIVASSLKVGDRVDAGKVRELVSRRDQVLQVGVER